MGNKGKSQGEIQKYFLEKATRLHGDKYDYSQAIYVNNRTPVIIKCNICQTIFTPIPFNFYKYKNCPTCTNTTQRNDTKTFIELATKTHGDKYDYSQTTYVNAKTKVSIKCKSCNNIFLQKPTSHIYGESGCPICRQSHGEAKISLILKLLNIHSIHEYKFKDCVGKTGNPLRFDFYLPLLNMCIEYDGKQHTDKTSKYWSPSVEENDKIKTLYCEVNNIILKRIPYTKIHHIEKILKTILF